MWRLLIISGVQQGRALRLKTGVNRVGRSTDNHFQIPDPSVSSAHCEIMFSDAGTSVRDLNSTNGTYIEGEPVSEAPLEPGQLLQLGNIEMRLEELVDAPEPAPISIPELPIPPVVGSVTLPDGSIACANHPGLVGAYKCTGCQQALCETCVRVVRRISGGVMVFCSLCDAQCERLLPPTRAPKRKQSLLGRLTQTLKLPFKRPG